MMNRKLRLTLLGTICILLARSAYTQEKTAVNAFEVHLVITDTKLRQDAELPPLQKEDVKVKQGKNFLRVTQLIPAQGDNAALQLMILIDDTLDTSVGNNLTDLKNFITAQPASTVIGVGYMSNAGVNIAQNFTSDHDAAVKAGAIAARLALDDGQSVLIPDQLGEGMATAESTPRSGNGQRWSRSLTGRTAPAFALGTGLRSHVSQMPTTSTDANSASEISQRYNVIVFPIYAVGVGRVG